MDSRATGSAEAGSARSSWKASQSEEQPPAEPPVAAIRGLSMLSSFALERRNWIARAASSSGAATGGSSLSGAPGRNNGN